MSLVGMLIYAGCFEPPQPPDDEDPPPPPPSEYTLSVGKGGGGNATVSGSGISCGSVCSVKVRAGSSVNLSVSVAADSYFVGWGGACTGTGSCSVTMDSDKSVTAEVRLKPQLTVNKPGPNINPNSNPREERGEGVVTSSSGGIPSNINCGGICSARFNLNSTVTLTASPSEGSSFEGWGGVCSSAGKNTSCTINMSQSQSAVAYFVLDPLLRVKKEAPPDETPDSDETTDEDVDGNIEKEIQNSRITDNFGKIQCLENCSQQEARYKRGTVVTLRAITLPDSDTRFVKWEGACTGTNPECRVSMTEPREAVAKFEEYFPDETWNPDPEEDDFKVEAPPVPLISEEADESDTFEPESEFFGRYTTIQCDGERAPTFTGFASGYNWLGTKPYRQLENTIAAHNKTRLGNFVLRGAYRPRLEGVQKWGRSLAQAKCHNKTHIGVVRDYPSVVTLYRKDRRNEDLRKKKMLLVSRTGDAVRQNIRTPSGTWMLNVQTLAQGGWSGCRVHNNYNQNVLPQMWLMEKSIADTGGVGRDLPFIYGGTATSKKQFPANESKGGYFTTPTTNSSCNDRLVRFQWDSIDRCKRYGERGSPRYKQCAKDRGGETYTGAAFVGGEVHKAMGQAGYVLRFGLHCRYDGTRSENDQECYRKKKFYNNAKDRNGNLLPKKQRWRKTEFRNKAGQRAEASRLKLELVDQFAPKFKTESGESIMPTQPIPGGSTLRYPLKDSSLPWRQYKTLGKESSRRINWAAADKGSGIHEIMIESDTPDSRPYEKPRMVHRPIISPKGDTAQSEGYFAPRGWRVAVAPGTWLPTEGIEYHYRWEYCPSVKGVDCKNLSWDKNYLSNQAWQEIPGESSSYTGSDRGWIRAFVSASNNLGKSEEFSSRWLRIFNTYNNYPGWKAGLSAIYPELERRSNCFVFPIPDCGGDNLLLRASQQSHVIGSPREGQTIVAAGGMNVDWGDRKDWARPLLYRCRNIMAPTVDDLFMVSFSGIDTSEGTECSRRESVLIHNFEEDNDNEYQLTRDDVGNFLRYRGGFPTPNNDWYYDATWYSDQVFPAIQTVHNLTQYGVNFGSPASDLTESEGSPSAKDWGILPAHALMRDQCNPSLENLPAAEPEFRPYVDGRLYGMQKWVYGRKTATATNPCEENLRISGQWDTEVNEEDELLDIWQEGINENLILSVRDFCTDNYQSVCHSNVARYELPDTIVDTTEPSMVSSENKKEDGMDITVEPSEDQPGYQIERGVRCKIPDGENDWHISDPECFVQVVDRYKACAKPFDWNKFECDVSPEPTSLLRFVEWRGDFLEGTPLPGRVDNGINGDTKKLLETNFPLRNLRDGRPSVEVRAGDRADNETDWREFEKFVKIDRQPPIAPLIVDGPSETVEEGFEDICLNEDTNKYQLQGAGCQSFAESVPRPPDETNDKRASLSSGEDCVLCWEIVGLEEAEGKKGTFEYDEPGQLQCELLWGGTGRTPSGQPADWVDPPWPLNMSSLAQANYSAPVVASRDNCAPEEHDGRVRIAPFDMNGRPDGHYLFRVRQKDRAGWTSPWVGRPLVFDTTPPEPVSIYSLEGETDSSATRQWLFDWGWDLLARDGLAGTYCFVAESGSEQILRRSGWGCGPTPTPDNAGDVNGPQNTPYHNSLGYTTLRRDLPRGLETPMPFPGVEGEGRGTLAGLPDGSYRLGIWQRDKLGQRSEPRDVCLQSNQAPYSQPCVPFLKSPINPIGTVPEPDVQIEADLPKESVTSRRTEAKLTVRAANPLLANQAFFPMSGSILHATPQEIYAYCQYMDENYSEYMPDNAAWGVQRPLIGEGYQARGPCPGAGEVSAQDAISDDGRLSAIRYSGALALNGANPASPQATGDFILNIFWLRPTLAEDDRPAKESAYGGSP